MIRNLKIIQLLLIVAITAAATAEKTYVCTTDGYVIGFDGMNRGMNNVYGGTGDTSFTSFYVGKPISTVVAADLTGGPNHEIIVGTNSGTDDRIMGFDITLEHILGSVMVNKPVSSMAFGSVGILEQALVVGTGDFSSQLIIYDRNLEWVFTQSFGTPIAAVRLGELEAGYQNLEIIVGAVSGTVKSTSRIAAYRLYIDGNYNLKLSSLWGTSWGPNNVIKDLVAANIYDAFAGDEFFIVGNSNDSSGNIAGDGQLAYKNPGGGAVPEYLWWSNLDHAPQDVTVAGVVADVFPGNPGYEIVVAGNSLVYIIDANPANDHAVNVQIIETNQPCTSVAVADVIGDDGLPEIIVGTFSGILIAYEHSDLNNPDSLFVLEIDGSRGGVLSLDPQGDGTIYQIKDIAVTKGCASFIAPDLNEDCEVDSEDLFIFSESWLDSSY